MAGFDYIALDTSGDRSRGHLDADSERQARQQLRLAGLTPLTLKETTRRKQAGSKLFKPRLGNAQLALITRQLAGLLRSGLPMDEALAACISQTDNRVLISTLKSLRARVLEGYSLGQAIDQFPHLFSPLFRATVSAGEQTRELPEILLQLADHMERQQQIRQQLTTAMIYPAILVTTSLLIIAGLMTYVVPEVVKVFASSGNQLPTITRLLIATSSILREWWLMLLVVLLGLAVTLRGLLRLPGPGRQLHRLWLMLPVAGNLTRQANAARFCRTLAILLRSSIPLIEALKIATNALTNVLLRESVNLARTRVHEGESLHQALSRPARFPKLTLHLIGNGEASGDLEKMLDTAADTHERQVTALTSLLLGLLEPAIILFLGLAVLLIVVAILLPIFELNQLV